jgi:hypothetical protein
MLLKAVFRRFITQQIQCVIIGSALRLKCACKKKLNCLAASFQINLRLIGID